MFEERTTGTKRAGFGHIFALALLLVALVAALPGLAFAEGDHDEHQSGWTKWDQIDALPNSSGKFYLSNNVELDATWVVPSGGVTLCLNGHTVKLQSGKKGSLAKVSNGANLTLDNCKGDGAFQGGTGTEGKGGAVLVEEGGTFVLDGAAIEEAKAEEFGEGDNKVSQGGGVYVAGTFSMIGGTVEGNTATQGADVYVSEKGTFKVEGTAKVTKVDLANGRLITVTGELKEEATLGVTKLDADGNATSGVVTSDYSKFNNSVEPSTYIKSNDATYEVFWNDVSKEAQLAKKVTLTFDANGGEGNIGSITGAEDSKVNLPYNNGSITRDNYDFDGWNTAQDGTGDPYKNGQTDVKLKQMTLYAQWKEIPAKTFTISYDKNDTAAKGETKEQTATEGVELTLNANGFSLKGHTFKEWNTKADGKGTSYSNGGNYTFEEDTTLYAQWETEVVTLTFDKNNKKAKGTMDAQQAKWGEQFTLKENEFKLSGYTFDSWNTEPDGSGKKVSNKAKVTLRANMTFYAQWAENYTISFNKNADDATGTMTDQTATEGKALTLNKNAFTLTGYSFKEWNTKKDGSGKAYSDGAKAKFTADTELFAQWTKNTDPDSLMVTFDKNADDATGSMAPQTAKKGEAFALNANSFTRSGYTFVAWNTKADGSGIRVPNNAKVKLNSNVTLYAQWSKNGSQGGVRVRVDDQTGLKISTFTTVNKTTVDTLQTAVEAMASADEKEQGVLFTLTASPRTLSALSSTDQSALNDFISRYKLTNGVVFDLSLSKQVGGGAVTSVSTTPQKVALNVQVPSSLQTTSTTNKRTFYLLRIHEGQVSALAGTTSATLTGQTDQFSTYAIAYRDTTQQNNNNSSNRGGTTNRTSTGTSTTSSSKTKQATAKTGDSSMTGIAIAAIAVVGVGVLAFGVVSKRKRKS